MMQGFTNVSQEPYRLGANAKGLTVGRGSSTLSSPRTIADLRTTDNPLGIGPQ
jgi:hypothetical protein